MDHPVNCRKETAGSALIEALVGGIIIAVIVIAVFQVLAAGSSLNQRELLRRRAYQELERVLESPQFSYRSPNYINLDTLPNLIAGYPKPVTLDTRGTLSATDDLTGTINVLVTKKHYSYGTVLNIPAKRIMATITYAYEGVNYFDTLETLITLVSIN